MSVVTKYTLDHNNQLRKFFPIQYTEQSILMGTLQAVEDSSEMLTQFLRFPREAGV